MQTKPHRSLKGFTATLCISIFWIWIAVEVISLVTFPYSIAIKVGVVDWFHKCCIPLSPEQQKQKLQQKLEYQMRKAAREFDTINDKESARLPPVPWAYTLIKLNGHFYIVPSEYSTANGFKVRWPEDVNKLLKKKWKNGSDQYISYSVFLHSPQYYDFTRDVGGTRSSFNHLPCENGSWWFTWNGILVRIHGLTANAPTLTDEQAMDVCLTALKILNEEIKEVHYVN